MELAEGWLLLKNQFDRGSANSYFPGRGLLDAITKIVYQAATQIYDSNFVPESMENPYGCPNYHAIMAKVIIKLTRITNSLPWQKVTRKDTVQIDLTMPFVTVLHTALYMAHQNGHIMEGIIETFQNVVKSGQEIFLPVVDYPKNNILFQTGTYFDTIPMDIYKFCILPMIENHGWEHASEFSEQFTKMFPSRGSQLVYCEFVPDHSNCQTCSDSVRNFYIIFFKNAVAPCGKFCEYQQYLEGVTLDVCRTVSGECLVKKPCNGTDTVPIIVKSNEHRPIYWTYCLYNPLNGSCRSLFRSADINVNNVMIEIDRVYYSDANQNICKFNLHKQTHTSRNNTINMVPKFYLGNEINTRSQKIIAISPQEIVMNNRRVIAPGLLATQNSIKHPRANVLYCLSDDQVILRWSLEFLS